MRFMYAFLLKWGGGGPLRSHKAVDEYRYRKTETGW
jgi:hypothetical protein